jgi:hypothetical protein
MSGFLTGTAYTASVYVKRVAGSTSNLSNLGQYIRYNLSPSGQTDITTALATLNGPTDALINSRFTTTGTTTGTLSGVAGVFVLFSHSSGVAVDITLRLGLPQVEAGAFATSPILTSGTSATRSADIATITGTAFSGWYDQAQGTVYHRGSSAIQANFFSLDDVTVNNRITSYMIMATAPRLWVSTGGVAQADITSSAITAGSVFAQASAYQANSFATATNGGTPGSTGSGTVPTVTRLVIGANIFFGAYVNGPISRLTYWPQRLPNATLQSLTV